MAETRLPAGVDPMDPKIIEEMRSGADRVEAENQPPDSLVEAQDLTDTQTIAGFRCRPMSAGLFALLELVKAPILSSDAEKEGDMLDMMVIMFLLLSDTTDDELVELAEAGYPVLRRATLKWSFKLDMATMSEIQAALPVMLERFQSAMDLYGGDGDKKK